ncbi:MAG TPA: MarR family transcriptional regulator [Stellaceae bacterium]|nr:MarR family transcriptional regulator [Stellaceae bacterium]
MPDGDESDRAALSLVELHIQLLKLASLINRPMKEGVAEPHALSLDELKVIMCVGGEGPIAGHEIRELMAIPPMNVSRALDVLRTRGWIERVDDEADRRRKPVRLTPHGRETLQVLLPNIGAVAAYLLGELEADEQAALALIARKIIARMEAWPADHPAA